VDSIVAEMNLDEFQSVLDQVVNHSIPDSQKSPLVRKLNQQVAEDQENSLEACFRTTTLFDNSTSKKDSQRKPNGTMNLVSSARSNGILRHDSKGSSEKTTTCSQKPIDSIDQQSTQPVCSNEATESNSSLQNLQQFCDNFMNRNPEYNPLTHLASRSSIRPNGALMPAQNGRHLSQSASNAASSKLWLRNESEMNGNGEPLEIEMRDLGRKAQIVEYCSSSKMSGKSGSQSVDTFIDLSEALGGESTVKASSDELAQVAACNTVYSNPTKSSSLSTDPARSNVIAAKSLSVASKDLNIVEKFFNPLGLNTALVEENGKIFSFVDCFKLVEAIRLNLFRFTHESLRSLILSLPTRPFY
jgi:hypothetical protein